MPNVGSLTGNLVALMIVLYAEICNVFHIRYISNMSKGLELSDTGTVVNATARYVSFITARISSCCNVFGVFVCLSVRPLKIINDKNSSLSMIVIAIDQKLQKS